MYYILEHPTRGTFREMDHDWRAGTKINIPRFSSSGSRNDPEKAMRFGSVATASDMRKLIVATDGRIANKVSIRRSDDFKALCLECGMWTDTWHEHDRQCSVYREEVARHNR